MPEKRDVVIEAVRYGADGKIEMVRLYDRRGQVWSDLLLANREGLFRRLEQGKKVFIGRRKPYFGSAFEFGSAVNMVGGTIISEGKWSGQDHLAGIPLF